MLPHYFVYTPAKYGIVHEDGVFEEFFVTETSSFAKSEHWQIFLNTIAAFRSVGMCLIDIVLNAIVIYYFDKFLRNKGTLMNFSLISRSRTPPASNVTSSIEASTEPATKQFIAAPMVSRTYANNSANNLNTTTEKSITKTVIVHCTASLAHQILLLGTFFYTISATDAVTNSAILLFVVNYVSVIRQAINFILFYFCNTKFQKDVKAVFSRFFKTSEHV
jgi:hypothetical protein